jgi:hypothetical protein
MKQVSKEDVMNETRLSEQIDVSKEPNLYFALLAWETHGVAIRDNTLAGWIEIGMKIEREY